MEDSIRYTNTHLCTYLKFKACSIGNQGGVAKHCSQESLSRLKIIKNDERRNIRHPNAGKGERQVRDYTTNIDHPRKSHHIVAHGITTLLPEDVACPVSPSHDWQSSFSILTFK